MMLDTVRRFLGGIAAEKDRRSIKSILDPLADRYSSLALNTAGLVIKSGSSPLAKTGSADCYAIAKGVLVKVAASTDMPALTGLNIAAGKTNVYCFFIDSAAVVTVAMGTEGAALGNVVFPQFPENKALLGFLIVPAVSAFTGGTTALDVPSTVYINTPSGFDPRVLLT